MAESEWAALVGGWLQDCVIRPLAAMDAASDARAPSPGVPAAEVTVQERLWELTTSVTTLCAGLGAPTGVLQAAAGLQELVCRLAEAEGPDAVIDWTAELNRLQPGLAPQIRVAPDGPYLLTGVTTLYTHLGEPVPTRPQMSLCRCGESASKPSCDGACARTGFVGDKDPRRVSDQRDAYIGQQATVLDNRGICQHSGHCTDRLATVFHLGEESFVTPSGGRMDEIIRAVRDCPSGALSYAVDTVEARQQVDYAGQREPAIEVSKAVRTGSAAGSGWSKGTAKTFRAMTAPLSSTTHCVAAGTRRTSRSAPACTGTWGSPIRHPTQSGPRRSSSGPVGSRP